MERGGNTPKNGGETPTDALKRVRSEGCVLRRQPLVRNSPLPLTSCYRLDEVIGRGSFGCTVFTATDVLSGVRRVVKCVRKEEPDGIRLWRNEVRMLRTLDHPNILRLFEVFDESGAVYQVTETCHGGDLHQWLDRRLRRRHRHARKKQNSFLQLAHGPQQQQEQLPVHRSGIDSGAPGIPEASAGAGSAAQEAGNSPEVQQAGSPEGAATVLADSDSSNAASCGSLSAGHRLGTSMTGGCPVAAGAAAAAATVAAAGLQCDAGAPVVRPLMREELAARLVAQLLYALRYLHSKGIAHCDIKLENLLLLNELGDSEAGDGQSSDEEEEQLRCEDEQRQQQLLLLQQQQQQDSAALSRARRGLRARSSVQLNAAHDANNAITHGFGTSSSSNALAVVPMVLRKRRVCREVLEWTLEEHSHNSSSQSLIDGLSRREVTVKLADFGLARKIVKAKPLKMPQGREGFCGGTLYYRSPWIIRGLTEGDARSDLWAVGVLLFTLLTGSPPFNGDEQEAVEKAISETPVSFGGGVWASISLQCVGFLRALLYNPLIPLHLRGPPPPPPYAQPTADMMLKHPWIQQCVRKERRRGLMRVVSAPSIQRTWGPPGGSTASKGVPQNPATNAPGLQDFGDSTPPFPTVPLRGAWQLGHPQRTPSEPHCTQEMQEELAPHSADVDFVRTASDPPLGLHSAHAEGPSGTGNPRCCSTCSMWSCTFGCCSAFEHAAPQPLRICWGRAPLVFGRGLAVQQQYRQQQQLLRRQEPQQDLQHQKRAHSPTPDMMVDSLGSPHAASQNQGVQQGKASETCCALRAAGVSSLKCITCGDADPRLFSYEDTPAPGLAVTTGAGSDDDSEQLQPHLRLSKASFGLHGLETCAAATNAAAAAAAAAAGVGKAVRREAIATVSERSRLPLENVPHLHLRFRPQAHCTCRRCSCKTSYTSSSERLEVMEVETETGASSDNYKLGGHCCIAVVHWLTAELFEARVALLLQACAWLDFARLSPLQRALRSVVVKLMEEDTAVRLVRDVFWVLDPQQSGSVSRQCLLDSLRVVGDFFALEFAARQPEEDRRFGCLSDARETLSGCEGLLKVAIPPGLVGEASPRTPVECESPSQSGSGWTDKAPTSPLQAMLMFATLSPGDMPPLAVLEPYCKVLQRALEPEPVTRPLASDAAIGTPEAPVLGSFPSEVSTASGDSFVHRCQLGEALVCLDTDGSGTVEFDEFLAASMTRADFKEREPACSVAFRLLDRNVDGFVSANDLLSILHFDSRSDLQGVLRTQKQRADAAVAATKSAIAAAQASGGPSPPGALLDDSELVTGRDEQGELMSVPAGASYLLQLEGVTAATVQLYVEVARELKAIQHRPSGLWTFEEFMKLL